MPASKDSMRDQLVRLLKQNSLPSASEAPSGDAKKNTDNGREANSRGSAAKNNNPNALNATPARPRKKKKRRGKRVGRPGIQTGPNHSYPSALVKQRQQYAEALARSKGRIMPEQSTPLGFDSPMVSPDGGTHFKRPAGWVDKGRELQISKNPSRDLKVTIGLDFGTAFSKAAIRAAGKVFFIDWNGISAAKSEFFFGGGISVETDGLVLPGHSPSAAENRFDLKRPFIEHEQSYSHADYSSAVAFMAWVFRYARAWLFDNQRSLLLDNRLIWEVNLGAPTGSWAGDSKKKLKERYRDVAAAAWQLSQESTIHISRATALAKQCIKTIGLSGLDHIGIIPEFAAQIGGYVKSPQRAEGMHFLVDAGAGTLDIACFRVMKDPRLKFSDRFPVFSSNVERLGTYYLMKQRAIASRNDNAWRSQSPVPTTEEYITKFGGNPGQLKNVDQDFIERCSKCISAVAGGARAKDPTAPEWKTELPVFFAGGGSRTNVYREAVHRALTTRRITPSVRNFPLPLDIEDSKGTIDETVFGRLSVAYGLTYDAEEIGTLIPPHDIPALITPSGTNRPDRDELYPK